MNIGFSKTTILRFEGRIPFTWDAGRWPGAIKPRLFFFGLCRRKSLQFGGKIVNALGVCFRFRFGCIFTKCETFSTRIRLPIHIFITPKRWEAEYIICIKRNELCFWKSAEITKCLCHRLVDDDLVDKIISALFQKQNSFPFYTNNIFCFPTLWGYKYMNG